MINLQEPHHGKALTGGLRAQGSKREKFANLPIVSIVTVVMNGIEHIEKTILSVLNQGYANIEYIIVDGGSTDGTLDVIRKYEEYLEYWISESDSGIYDAMNKGIALCSGELVGLLNADDSYEPNAINAVVDSYKINGQNECILYGNYKIYMNMLVNETVSACSFKTKNFFNWFKLFKVELLKYRTVDISPKLDLLKSVTLCHQALFVSRSVYQKSNYDLRFKLAADYHFMLNNYKFGIPYVKVNQTMVRYRGDGATFQRFWRSNFETLLAFHDVYKFNSLEFLRFFSLRSTGFVKLITKLVVLKTLKNFLK